LNINLLAANKMNPLKNPIPSPKATKMRKALAWTPMAKMTTAADDMQ
jgi:hypothetical protein